MPTSYARCNNFLSGATSAPGVNCAFMARAESEQEVIDQVFSHLKDVHSLDGNDLIETIKRCVFTRGSKVFGTRDPAHFC